ncbi:MAG: hypothetical protein V2J24_21135 [Pseudomonadales bacterium]|jgi:hypothetical protein|nr:hypothetical protein [Pseudomonadales bacterium]
MPIALDPEELHPYILESDRGTDSPTVFHLRPLPARIRRTLRDGVGLSETGVKADLGRIDHTRVQYGLVRWDNWLTVGGEPVEGERVKGEFGMRQPDAIMDRLRESEIMELAAEVDRLGRLDPPSGS